MINTDIKKKFVVAISDESLAQLIADHIRGHVKNPQVVIAADGSDAFSKIKNDPPHVLIVERPLAKISGEALVESLFNEKAYRDLGVIFLSDIPESEIFIDAVVTGQVQFLANFDDSIRTGKVIAKSLNYAFRSAKNDFRLLFLAPGEFLIKQGETPDNVYIVKKGQLKAYMHKSADAIEVGKVEEGEFVGEMAYINQAVRTADVVAASDCELIVIPIDHLDHLLFQKPAWSKALMQTLSRRLQETNQRVN